jgi:hypothetical protein
MEFNIILVSNDISSIMNTSINLNFCSVLLSSIKVFIYPCIGILYCAWTISAIGECLLAIAPIVIDNKTFLPLFFK